MKNTTKAIIIRELRPIIYTAIAISVLSGLLETIDEYRIVHIFYCSGTLTLSSSYSKLDFGSAFAELLSARASPAAFVLRNGTPFRAALQARRGKTNDRMKMKFLLHINKEEKDNIDLLLNHVISCKLAAY